MVFITHTIFACQRDFNAGLLDAYAARPQGCGLRHSSAKMVRRICSSTPFFLQVEVMATISVGIDLAKNVFAREPPDRRKSLMSLMG